jgi:hypothetical protein
MHVIKISILSLAQSHATCSQPAMVMGDAVERTEVACASLVGRARTAVSADRNAMLVLVALIALYAPSMCSAQTAHKNATQRFIAVATDDAGGLMPPAFASLVSPSTFPLCLDFAEANV